MADPAVADPAVDGPAVDGPASTGRSNADVGRDMALTAIAWIAVPMAGIITAPILARALDVEGRGALAGATAPLLLMTTLAMIGIPEAVTYRVARHPALARLALRRAAVLLLASGIAGTLLTVALASTLSDGDPDIGDLIVLAALAIAPTLVLGALRGAASGLHAWSLVNAERYLTAGLRLVATVATAATGTLTVRTATVIAAVTPLVGGLVYARLGRRIPPGEATGDGLTRGLLSYGSRIWIGGLSGVLLSRLDQAIMLPLAGADGQRELGLYAAAVTIADVALLANNAVREVTLSADAATQQDDRLTASARASFAVSLAIGLGLTACLPIGFPLLFGKEFADGAWVAAVLVLGSVLGVPGSVAGAGLSARGRPGLRSASLVVAAVVNVVALFLLVPPLGAMGAALCTLLGNLLAANANIVFMRYFFGVRPLDFYAVRRSDLNSLASVGRRVLKRAS